MEKKPQSSTEESSIFDKKVSRRNVLKTAGAGGVGMLIGASGIGGLLSLSDTTVTKGETIKDVIPFYGKHQAGITTETQNHLYFASLEVTAGSREELIQLFKDWTEAAAAMTEGKAVGDHSGNHFLPPKDTGEAAGLSPSNLTITFGVGPELFEKNGKDRFGLKGKKPKELKDLPKFPLDSLEDKWNGGDICIQACADDLQVSFHAIRNLVRIARGKAVIHWAQTGFQRTKQADSKKETPRNLFGFKDGTVNPNVQKETEMDQQVWIQSGDGADWLADGSYMVVRRVQMYIEVWDRSTLRDQENTFGRHRDSGAPLGHKNEFDKADYNKKDENGQPAIPTNAHMRLAHGDGKQQILRRAYSYADGMDPQTGSFDAGLLFICFQRNPEKQFIPMQQRLAKNDKLNEYTVHKGSAMFACLPGTQKGGYIGDTLFS
ncbi:deferrochelatase/peroxidase EfeB [Peribacillus cavernae]|uniref:Deferrochelatase n=1 Tax=Peribacillus cavernae TaxID=1674310 RepID=A0A3S0VWI2_9BACI|nr:iron uptake transporter deferrochelatase/peroxidase subunit [Peribacillus cavernae]MDQ0220247.1 deferrochelatase/peroxidase EfeB [Peribacillus cavernae]RUQ27661.1 deferrochelatase/peroxidase EfeB [Peribacillus cavernae]